MTKPNLLPRSSDMASETSAEFSWPPLESNPEVFTEYLYQLGLPSDWFVGEVFGLDDDSLGFVPRPVVAVIVTFESLKKETDAVAAAKADFFMKQSPKLDYACGVIACIHSVLNSLDSITLVENSILEKYYRATKTQSPADRATTLENMTEFQEVHTSYASLGQSSVPTAEDDVKHHFVTFVQNALGQLIELDGLKKGPVVVNAESSDILKDTAAVIQARIEAGVYSDSLAVLTLAKVADE
ncbi:hypothetical protein H257_03463 [Aphanomyces astaci]|uniref:Ubiquitin carboxyl-terminal hydrolase n=1 Tax=Aphanomyces astaci TaxID=112090 RepID=W4GWX9_APHAT|nr:hypothetical protein H257_03463 [Aphanomyces astaci]ETV84177.1 hypothetical protein H257_03463 [Aphanomyces astaci]RQM20613.1 hypothetical protein B5M09_010386 [Aphanomyces astaci]|eukprot:XP_009825869.1 hypothetical protein H257_03463 [Aphanomyces astaci]